MNGVYYNSHPQIGYLGPYSSLGSFSSLNSLSPFGTSSPIGSCLLCLIIIFCLSYLMGPSGLVCCSSLIIFCLTTGLTTQLGGNVERFEQVSVASPLPSVNDQMSVANLKKTYESFSNVIDRNIFLGGLKTYIFAFNQCMKDNTCSAVAGSEALKQILANPNSVEAVFYSTLINEANQTGDIRNETITRFFV